MTTTTAIIVVLLAVQLLFALTWLIVRMEQTFHMLRKERDDHSDEVAFFSHRMRTPLTSIRWYMEMLMAEEFGKLQMAQLEMLGKIEQDVSQWNEILNVLVDSSGSAKNCNETGCELVSVLKIVQDAANAVTAQKEEKNQTLNIYKGSSYVAARTNPLIFRAVLDVLISNAIAYTPPGGTITITIGAEEEESRVIVRDTGVGIPIEERDDVFRKFARGSEAKKMHVDGNGLGLYLAKKQIGKLGGMIDFTSKIGEGTEFTVSVPRGK